MMVGGPLGAILGTYLGHRVIDKKTNEALAQVDQLLWGHEGLSDKKLTFAIGVIVLAAKLSKTDGQVTAAEIDAFRQVFVIDPSEEEMVGRIFDQARQDDTNFEIYARQLAKTFAGEKKLLEELLSGLFFIARADGQLHSREDAFLRRVSIIFGINSKNYQRIKNLSDPSQSGYDPYQILGVTPSASEEEIKRKHRALVRAHHPDKVIAAGLPEEFISHANDKLATINAAYEEVTRLRQAAGNRHED